MYSNIIWFIYNIEKLFLLCSFGLTCNKSHIKMYKKIIIINDSLRTGFVPTLFHKEMFQGWMLHEGQWINGS